MTAAHSGALPAADATARMNAARSKRIGIVKTITVVLPFHAPVGRLLRWRSHKVTITEAFPWLRWYYVVIAGLSIFCLVNATLLVLLYLLGFEPLVEFLIDGPP